MSKTPVVKESNRPGVKQYEFDNEFSDDKFGKCPIQCVHPKPNEKALPSIIFNPKCQWSDSPIEAMQCALNQLTGTHDQDVAIEIIDRAVSAMPLTHKKDYNTIVIYQSLSDCEPKDAIKAKLCAQST